MRARRVAITADAKNDQEFIAMHASEKLRRTALGSTLWLWVAAGSALAAETTKTYDVETFTAIEASGEFSLQVKAGAPKTLVRLTASDAVLQDLDVRVVEGILEIGRTRSSGWRWPWQDKSFVGVIEMPSLEGIDASGAVAIEAQGIKAEEFTLDLSGAAKVRLAGEAKTFTVDLSGAGKIDAVELKADIVRADVSGAGKIECYARKVLEADVSGAGQITYAGTPAVIRQEVSGVGKVAPRG